MKEISSIAMELECYTDRRIKKNYLAQNYHLGSSFSSVTRLPRFKTNKTCDIQSLVFQKLLVKKVHLLMSQTIIYHSSS